MPTHFESSTMRNPPRDKSGRSQSPPLKKPLLGPSTTKNLVTSFIQPSDVESHTDQKPSDESVDLGVFQQILELDELDDEDYTFSKGMVMDYFEQAEATFEKMEDQFKRRDMEQFGSYGHFLKGSSAALGIAKVRATCEDIQRLGDRKDPGALNEAKSLLIRVKEEYAEAHQRLDEIYIEKGSPLSFGPE